MIFVDFLLVLVLALVLSGVLAYGLGWRHPAQGAAVGASALFLFLILMFAMWAGGVWLPPWGPVWYGTTWLPFLLVGLLVSLLFLAIATPARRPRTVSEAEKQEEEAAVAVTAFGIFFWILIFGLLIAVLVRYLVM